MLLNKKLIATLFLGLVVVGRSDRGGSPLVGKKVDVGFFLPSGWKEEIKSGITDKEGRLTIKCGLTPENIDQYLIVSAGILAGEDKGDLIFVKLVIV